MSLLDTHTGGGTLRNPTTLACQPGQDSQEAQGKSTVALGIPCLVRPPFIPHGPQSVAVEQRGSFLGWWTYRRMCGHRGEQAGRRPSPNPTNNAAPAKIQPTTSSTYSTRGKPEKAGTDALKPGLSSLLMPCARAAPILGFISPPIWFSVCGHHFVSDVTLVRPVSWGSHAPWTVLRQRLVALLQFLRLVQEGRSGAPS